MIIQHIPCNLNKLSSHYIIRLKTKLMDNTKGEFDLNLGRIYDARFKKYGATPKGSYWISEARQNLRFKILLHETIKLQKQGYFSIGDIGCGYGALANYISKTQYAESVRYYGYDISEALINHCRLPPRFHWATFEKGSHPHIEMDFCLMSGTYNLSATEYVDEWEDYIFRNLSDCWLQTKIAIIFNLQIDKEARISSGNIFYGNKNSILHRCNLNFGPTRSVENSSLPHDTTFVVQRK